MLQVQLLDEQRGNLCSRRAFRELPEDLSVLGL